MEWDSQWLITKEYSFHEKERNWIRRERNFLLQQLPISLEASIVRGLLCNNRRLQDPGIAKIVLTLPGGNPHPPILALWLISQQLTTTERSEHQSLFANAKILKTAVIAQAPLLGGGGGREGWSTSPNLQWLPSSPEDNISSHCPKLWATGVEEEQTTGEKLQSMDVNKVSA